MDHMHIPGTEPSSVILPSKVVEKKSDNPKLPKQAKAKKDGVIKPQNYDFNQFKHWKNWCSQNATNQPKSTKELGHMCPLELSSPPAVTLTK